mgnify:CR=1 FL=1
MSEREVYRVYRDGELVAESTAEACAEACGIDPWTVYVRKADPHDREGWAARHGKGYAVRREDAPTGEEVVLADEHATGFLAMARELALLERARREARRRGGE